MTETLYALSLKQPWATLLVHGKKCIEVRRWTTRRRGRVLIHAARIPDLRDEAWNHVTPELMEYTQLQGGILGVGEIRQCKAYTSKVEFEKEQADHLNDLSWYQEGLYGFVFANLQPVTFHRCKGNVRFFRVEDVTVE